MSFHLGKPILVMIIVAVVTGLTVAARPRRPRAQLVMWSFADSHVTSYRGAIGTPRAESLIGQFERLSGLSTDVKHVHGTALNLRLGAMFDRTELDPNQPEVAEVEIGSVGRYFRPPVDQIGFMPLNELLDRSGWRNRVLESRLAPWTKDGIVFGFPNDVHPVSIIYRKDLYDQAGIDLGSAGSWPEFQEACLRFQRYWRARGYPLRHAMELSTSASDNLVVMLLQRHINALDDRNRIHLTNPKVAQTIAFYAQLVAGPRAIATDATPGGNLWARDFAEGDLCAIVAPDWRCGYLKRNAPELSGKVAMMPMPVFDEGDAPTGSWGGTMAGIPRRCKDPEAAWKLITFLFSSKQGLEPRWRFTCILPAVTDLWEEPVFREPDPYFGGQKIGEIYISLARQMPKRYVTPFTALAGGQLTGVLTRAVERASEGQSPEALEADVRAWLIEEAADLQRRIDFAAFTPIQK